jgi:hypothetical protein
VGSFRTRRRDGGEEACGCVAYATRVWAVRWVGNNHRICRESPLWGPEKRRRGSLVERSRGWSKPCCWVGRQAVVKGGESMTEINATERRPLWLEQPLFDYASHAANLVR